MKDKKNTSAILLVEDDPGHAKLIEKNLKRANIGNDIIRIDNGQTALDFVFSEGDYKEKNRPSQLLILLDLNLPVLNGYEVLTRIKTDKKMRRIPIIILSTTENPAEISKCYDSGCNLFITKPMENLCDDVKKIGQFLSLVKIAVE